MKINSQQQFSAAQVLQPSGITWSATVDLGPRLNMPGINQPFMHVTAPMQLRANSPGTLRILIAHSADNETFSSGGVLLEALPIIDAHGWLAVAPLQAHTQRFVRLAYSIEGGPLTAGAITAFMSDDGPSAGQPSRSVAAEKLSPFTYHPSGFSLAAGFNTPTTN